MHLQPGQMLLHYRLVEKIGEGGMGVVWSADDTRLRRKVALKLLPQEFSKSPERLSRFEREARFLAALNHANIASIHGLEEADGVHFLALEYVPGETLAERLAGGPLPVKEALTLCSQLARTLEAAHAKGIIHRDLKPANIKVTPEGQVKVLDFGLAKAFGTVSTASQMADSPTITKGETREHAILGTTPYMSPEQASGKQLDKRTDIWAFGCVLHETLTGARVFQGTTVPETVAAIHGQEPDWQRLPEDLPPRIRDLLHRCLEKEPDRRLHDIADARIELEEPRDDAGPGATPSAAAATSGIGGGWIGAAGVAAGTLLGVVLSSFLMHRGAAPPAAIPLPALRASIILPDDESIHLSGRTHHLSLSPDGSRLAYVAHRGSTTGLSLRNMDDGQQRPLPGTEGAQAPFFSPDGEWLGFFANNKLQKIPLTGGDPTMLADVPPMFNGAAWGENGWIVVAPSYNESLARVSAGDRTIDAFIELHPERGEKGHLWPQVLPGGEAVLFTVRTGSDALDVEDSAIAIERLDTGERHEVVRPAHFARYVETGHLLFVRGRTLMAAPFDLDRAEIVGKAVPIADDVLLNSQDRVPQFTVSAGGLLVYAGEDLQESPRKNSVVWWRENNDRKVLPLPEDRAYAAPRLSPDGERLAVTVTQGNDIDIWIYELERGVMTLLTPEPGRDFDPVWSPDGDRLAYTHFFEGFPKLFSVPADGSQPAEPLRASSLPEFPSSWSANGSVLAFTVIHLQVQSLGHNMDIWTMQTDEPGSGSPWLETPFNETDAIFSPDGRWIAYVSDASGTEEIYIRPYPGPGGRTKVSVSGGRGPAWSADQRTLYYQERRGLMAVPVESAREIRVGTARLVLEGDFPVVTTPPRRNYDVSAEPGRYLMIERVAHSTRNTRLQVVTGWADTAAK